MEHFFLIFKIIHFSCDLLLPEQILIILIPFRCTICSCSYHYISSLTRHMIACHMDTSRRPPQLKDTSKLTINNTNQQQIIESNCDEVVQVIPLVEIDGNMQFETVDLDMDTIEHMPDEMEILEIPVQSDCTEQIVID